MNADDRSIIQRRCGIVECIQRAMRRACGDVFAFTEQSGRDLAAEYLLTVRVAEVIAEQFERSVRVQLEMRTKKFATECFPLFTSPPTERGFKRRTTVRKHRDIEKRSGRIDVAVSMNGAQQHPVCAIEVKRLKPNRKLVREDLERNAAYFLLRDEFGNRPMIEFSAFAALHRYRSGRRETDLEKVRKLYRSRVQQVSLPEGVVSRIIVFPAEELRHPICNDEVQEIDTESYLMIGVIVLFHWADHDDALVSTT